MQNARAVAFGILKNIFENKAYSSAAIDRHLKESGLDSRDRAFVTNIVYGTLTHLKYLDYQIAAYSKTGLKKLSLNVLIILRISVYQIKFMDKVPESAAVNEGVKLAKKQAYKSAGFVNAILRSYLREGEKLPPEKKVTEHLAVKYSFPEYMVSMWRGQFGEEKCESLLEALNQPPALSVRVNLTKTTVDDFIKNAGGKAGEVPSCVILPPMGAVSEIYGFEEGLFMVQDTAAQRVAYTMEPKKGHRVLDMCAAPGGKTTHIAEMVGEEGEVVAWDKYEHKIELINENAKRLGLENIKAYVHDGKDKDESLFEKFDAVLLDAPCSGLGIIKKKPEIKWERKKEDIAEIIKEQKELIDTAAFYVKAGGTLLYSTCTLNKEENEEVVEDFLEKHTDFSLCGDMANIFPSRGEDGFFIAKLERKK